MSGPRVGAVSYSNWLRLVIALLRVLIELLRLLTPLVSALVPLALLID